jgi:hypothetical protein
MNLESLESARDKIHPSDCLELHERSFARSPELTEKCLADALDFLVHQGHAQQECGFFAGEASAFGPLPLLSNREEVDDPTCLW